MADQSSVPVKTIQKRLEQTKLTEDGSILKMLLDPAPKNTTICSWEKGATTKFHYTTHTFVKKDDEKREKPVNHDQNCKHHHHGHLKNPIQDVVIKGKAPQSLSPSSASSIETSDNSESDKPIRKKIADTREIDPDTPFEMKIGYNFSVPAFELCVKSMKEGERSRFLIMPEMLQGYTNLEMVMRNDRKNKQDIAKGLQPSRRLQGCCASMMAGGAHEENADLHDLYSSPLELEIHLVKVTPAGTVKKEVWEMKNDERLAEVPVVKDEGAMFYKSGDHVRAQVCYERAVMLLESVTLSGEHIDTEREMRIDVTEGKPFIQSNLNPDAIYSLLQTCRLNYAACKLKLMDYPPVVAQCSEVIKKADSYSLIVPTNDAAKAIVSNRIKAHFRRAQAYRRIGRDLELAQSDLDTCRELLVHNNEGGGVDQLKEVVKEEALLRDQVKAHEQREKQLYVNLFA